MSLTRNSALFYWDALNGLQPIVGGDPVFARDGGATLTDRGGLVRTLPAKMPRFEWPTVDGTRRPALLLQPAATNVMPYSEQYEGGTWNNSSCTIASGHTDPSGGTGARLVSTTNYGAIYRAASLSTSTAHTISAYVRHGAERDYIGLSEDATGWRALVTVSWSADGTPSLTLTNGSATLHPPEQAGGGWWRLSFTVTSGASSAHTVYFYPAGPVASGSAYLYGMQVEAGSSATSYIRTSGSTASRVAEQLYFKNAPAPQAMMAYLRFIERGSIASPGARLLQLSNASETSPRLVLYNNNGVYSAYHQNGASVASSNATESVSVGEVVELVLQLTTEGRVRLIQSRNGAAATAPSVFSGDVPMPTSWSGDQLWLNSVGTALIGVTRLADVRVVRYADVAATTAQGVMDELRAFVLSPSGDIL